MSTADPSPAIPPAPPPSPRLISLDAYRGLIMLTLLCSAVFNRNLAGLEGWGWLVWNNEHSAWALDVIGYKGVRYWDLIQPSFMFMVGVAMPFSLAKRAAEGAPASRQFGHVLIRALNLILVGILLDHMGASKIQPGFIRVLQQIALGYIPASFIVGKSIRVQAVTAVVILVAYQLLWMFNPWNGPGGPWAKGNENIGSALDFQLRGQYYSGFYVGLNAIPSTATIIFGVMAGTLIQRRLPHMRTFLILLGSGLAATALGTWLSLWFPIIKIIWTPSWAIFAAGCTTLILSAFFLVIEVWGFRRWAFFLVVVGMNSIFAYCLPDLLTNTWQRLSGVWVSHVEDHWFGWAKDFPWRGVFDRGLFVLFAWLLLYFMWRRRIFLKC